MSIRRSKLRRIVTGGLLLLATPLVHAAAASEAGSEDASTDANALPEGIMTDRNGDGVLTQDEVMPGIFSLLDANRDGRAEISEVQASWRGWADRSGGSIHLPGIKPCRD